MKSDLFIILSLKHSEGSTPCFWRSNDAGYTIFPWAAGIYSKKDVENNKGYYNNGFDTLAIPLSNEGLESLGFKCVMDVKKVKKLCSCVLKRKEDKGG